MKRVLWFRFPDFPGLLYFYDYLLKTQDEITKFTKTPNSSFKNQEQGSNWAETEITQQLSVKAIHE